MGSGKVLQAAIKKHGAENFTKEILEHFSSKEEMYAREKEVVTEEFLARDDTYNLRCGGFGGFDYINANPDKFLTEKRLNSLMSNEERHSRWLNKFKSDFDFANKVRENARLAAAISLQRNGSAFLYLNKDPSFQEKRKQKFAEIGHSIGPKNSQFGTIWITDGIESKKIQKNGIVPSGWRRGRKIKHS